MAADGIEGHVTATTDVHGSDATTRATARRMWGRLEAIHTLHYFAPTVLEAHAGLGLEDRRVAYTASRSAPLGPVGPEVVTAMFYGFSPAMISAALPAAWAVASPETVVQTSLDALGALLRNVFAEADAEVARAAELLRELALLHPLVGRPLAAAWSSVAWHDDPAVRLWQAATVIRESRGDGHLACLVDAQLDGVECHLIARGDSEKLRTILGAMRGHAGPEWDAAVGRLAARGLMTAGGALTDAGAALRDHVEARTDALAAPPWAAFGDDAGAQLADTLDPLVARIVELGVLPGIVVRKATAS
jgi:hypothetical protein